MEKTRAIGDSENHVVTELQGNIFTPLGGCRFATPFCDDNAQSSLRQFGE
jgi:hypothetical protein